RLREPEKVSRPEDEPPYVYRARGRRDEEWMITVGTLYIETPPPEDCFVEVRSSACPRCGAVSALLGHLSMNPPRGPRRKRRSLSMNYGVIRHQERFVSQPGDLIVRGFPPYECPGCGSRLRLDTPSLDFEKVYELCCEG